MWTLNLFQSSVHPLAICLSICGKKILLTNTKKKETRRAKMSIEWISLGSKVNTLIYKTAVIDFLRDRKKKNLSYSRIDDKVYFEI